MSAFSCGCCRSVLPSMHKHSHHKIPKALGGKDHAKNLVDLCPGCHDTLHNVAHKLLSPKVSSSQVKDSLSLIYKDNEKARENCFELALIVRDATIKVRETGLKTNHVLSISTSIRKKHKDLVVLRCKEMNISQEGYFRSLVLTDLKKRFDIEVDPVVENKVIRMIKRGLIDV